VTSVPDPETTPTPELKPSLCRRGPRLGLLADAFDDEFQKQLLVAAEREAREQHLDFVAISGGMLGFELQHPKSFAFDVVSAHNVDALLICAHTIGHHVTPDQIAAFVQRYDPLPRICLGVEVPGLPSLLMNNEVGMYTAVKHLIAAHDRRKIAKIAGPTANSEAQARYRGFARALAEQGMLVDSRRIVRGDFTRRSGSLAVAELFDRRGLGPGEVDAIVCANDVMAFGALDELDRRGLRVPRDISLVGFDDLDFARYARVPLTTVRQPVTEQVRHAVRSLAAALHGTPLPRHTVTFETEFVRRRSCGCDIRSRERVLSWPLPSEAHDFAGALRAREESVVANLRQAAHSGFEFVPEDWEERLFSTFLAQVAEPEVPTFVDCVEDICYALLRRDSSVGTAHDVLMVLRRDALSCVHDAATRGRIYDLIQAALLVASDMAAIAQAQQRGELVALMGTVAEATAAMLAAPSVEVLSKAAAEHLPRLGIRGGAIALFTEGNQVTAESEAPLVFSDGARNRAPVRFPTSQIAPLNFLNGRSVVVVPLGFRGEKLGLAALEFGAADTMLYEDLRLVLSSAVTGALLSRAVDVARREVEKLAITDPLTGLFNRRYLSERIRDEFARMRRHPRSLSLALVDLDGFKQVNDRYGHEAGDRVLVTVAQRLRKGLREVDIVARFGGDEFVVLLPETDATQALLVSGRIWQNLSGQPIDEHGIVGASFGVATTDDEGAKVDQDELLRRADHALLCAKRAGKGRVLHFDGCPSILPEK
jgi:sigma-B regulation protein RsbU (phosphoserine phosphatase)